ncbi:hypothetical protein [Kitasatospora sp. NPDC058402]|uniref:hypothetical protein n=1 Tax=Kitasatospora sp. NPDC058402 TaxID=3346481 RepID=UPI00366817EC
MTDRQKIAMGSAQQATAAGIELGRPADGKTSQPAYDITRRNRPHLLRAGG